MKEEFKDIPCTSMAEVLAFQKASCSCPALFSFFHPTEIQFGIPHTALTPVAFGEFAWDVRMSGTAQQSLLSEVCPTKESRSTSIRSLLSRGDILEQQLRASRRLHPFFCEDCHSSTPSGCQPSESILVLPKYFSLHWELAQEMF